MEKRNAWLLALGASLVPLTVAAQGLYQADAYQSLVSDSKAHRLGDVVTVLVYETSSASTRADTGASRSTGMGVGVGTTTRNLNLSAKSKNDFEGGGKTERAGRLLAQLTVSVISITDNGDLVLSGEQLVDINNERQQIRVEGRVRRQDISDTNTVLSNRLADARISYLGEGDIAERQRPAWWQRFATLFGL